jgi:putative heme iron utilization protein
MMASWGDLVPGNNPGASPAATARLLVRRGLKAALATLDRGSGHPYASLVTMATEPDGAPIFLISRLALHTQNLLADRRASLLIDGTDAQGDPLAGARVTLVGQARPATSATARSRFLARHPAAASYVDFDDFAFYRLMVEWAHFVGGFGRITRLGPAELLLPMGDALDLVASEAEIVAEVNRDRSSEVELLATRLAGGPPGPWRLTGIDLGGLDLMFEGHTRRVEFSSPVKTAEAAKQQLQRLLTAVSGSS